MKRLAETITISLAIIIPVVIFAQAACDAWVRVNVDPTYRSVVKPIGGTPNLFDPLGKRNNWSRTNYTGRPND